MTEHFAINGESYAMVQCYSCAVWYLVPQVLNDLALKERGPGPRTKFIYCPNGHSWHYIGESEAAALRRERDRLKQDAARLEEDARTAWSTANAQLARAKKAEAEAARVTKRATAGVCLIRRPDMRDDLQRAREWICGCLVIQGIVSDRWMNEKAQSLATLIASIRREAIEQAACECDAEEAENKAYRMKHRRDVPQPEDISNYLWSEQTAADLGRKIRALAPSPVAGMPVIVSEAVPPGTADVRDDQGNLVGRIINVAAPSEGE